MSQNVPASASEEKRQPTLTMTGMRTEITQGDQPRQIVEAEWARLAETDKILDLRNLHVDFFDQGVLQGQAAAGRGTLWIADRPEENIARNDLLLESPVRYASTQGVELSSPRMRFDNVKRLLSSTEGFTKQIKGKDGYIIAEGQRIEIVLKVETAQFESWKEFGNPLIYRKSTEPVLKP